MKTNHCSSQPSASRNIAIHATRSKLAPIMGVLCSFFEITGFSRGSVLEFSGDWTTKNEVLDSLNFFRPAWPRSGLKKGMGKVTSDEILVVV